MVKIWNPHRSSDQFCWLLFMILNINLRQLINVLLWKAKYKRSASEVQEQLRIEQICSIMLVIIVASSDVLQYVQIKTFAQDCLIT